MKKGFTLAEDTKIDLENIKHVLKWSCAEKTDAKQTGNGFPSSGAVSAKQTGNGFPSSGGVSAKQTGWLLKNKSAFTLAEVLISLTIIGVIAAITVPALIQRTNKQEYVTALQKAYSTLSQVTNQIIAENGSPKADENGESWLMNNNSLFDMYRKYLNTMKECGTASGCSEQGAYKFLNGAQDWAWNTGSGNMRFILADGMQGMFFVNDKKCTSSYFDSNNTCAVIFVDVNGVKKPNKIGRDVFFFALKENGLYPGGCDGNSGSCVKSDGSLGAGHSCACKVLREGAMNY